MQLGTTYDEEHEAFRKVVRTWLEREIAPHWMEWERAGILPRSVFADAGRNGFLGFAIPEEYGGGGTDDFRFNAVLAEEIGHAGMLSLSSGLNLHNDITTPYFLEYCTDEQRRRWLPGIASGELITAVAMTEPGTGSDLAGMTTKAVRDGDAYVVNGSKTFITNGINSDLIIVAVRTDTSSRHGGLSLVVVERGMPGFERGRNLEKLGQHAQDTAELFFTDVRVPRGNLLGEEGRAFEYLVANLAQERLTIAINSLALAEGCIAWTVDYVRTRTAFGGPIGGFQATRHRLAELVTEVEVTRAYIDRCLPKHLTRDLSAVEAAQAKLWSTEVLGRVSDGCLQLFGGYGYMSEYPIARAYADARVARIYGGTNEIMKEIIGRDLALG
ncbi:MAG TPA: acyl-CoA dehydrogenase family protein [Sporichthya sp.]|nr:acyl-CoA dehydrogenase family protein [Sporichthya sp.]